MIYDLLHVEDEAFEVFAFGMIDVYGVVLRLMQLMQDPYFAPYLCGRTEHRQTEGLFIDRL